MLKEVEKTIRKVMKTIKIISVCIFMVNVIFSLTFQTGSIVQQARYKQQQPKQ